MLARGARPTRPRLAERGRGGARNHHKDLQRIDRVEDDVSRLDLLPTASSVSTRRSANMPRPRRSAVLAGPITSATNSTRCMPRSTPCAPISKARRRTSGEDRRRSQGVGEPDQAALARIDLGPRRGAGAAPVSAPPKPRAPPSSAARPTRSAEDRVRERNRRRIRGSAGPGSGGTPSPSSGRNHHIVEEEKILSPSQDAPVARRSSRRHRAPHRRQEILDRQPGDQAGRFDLSATHRHAPRSAAALFRGAHPRQDQDRRVDPVRFYRPGRQEFSMIALIQWRSAYCVESMQLLRQPDRFPRQGRVLRHLGQDPARSEFFPELVEFMGENPGLSRA